MGKGPWLAAPSADQGTWVGTPGLLSLAVLVFVTALSLSFGVPGELCQESVPSWTFLHRGVEDSVAQGPDASGLNPDSAASLGLPEPQFAHLQHGPSSPLPSRGWGIL